ncbi:YgfZ/GcvT domain-containing protein [Pseudoalteromonas fenneropenaei]|uniref:YgfZ/GcvT domain-containing protein n=1 Tax=Pseudoalteromonas fenneropenaei TaxID=1737459 RepID=A0ABV7CH63_9GAMM
MANTQAFVLHDGLIQLGGQDKLSYLHGQVTQDINLVTDEQFKWTGHCSPKGKLWGVFRVFKHQDSYLLWGSPAATAASLRELKKYGVFAKVTIAQSELKLIGLLTDDQSAVCQTLGIHFNEGCNACNFGPYKALKLDAQRLLLVVDESFSLPAEFALQSTDTQWQRAAILAGEPSLGEQDIDQYVPQMLNLQALDGISFRKGCYTGQETVARMRYLGKNKRALFIATATLSTLPASVELESPVESGWRRAGEPLQFAYDQNNGEFVCTIVLANDTSLDTVLRFKEQPDLQLKLVALPYSLDPQ